MLTTRINGLAYTFYQLQDEGVIVPWHFFVEIEQVAYFGSAWTLEKAMTTAWRHAYMR
jgi:hypothetical protein